MRSTWIRPAVKVAAVLLAGFVAFEWIGGRVLIRQFAKRYELSVDHRMVPHSTPEINGDGIRSLREAGSFTDATFNIIFLGDSFTFGFKLNRASEAFPALVEKALSSPERPLQVANFGWLSSSPLLSDRLLADIGARYSPDLVVLCLDLTDFQDDLKYTRMIDLPRMSPTAFLLREAGFGFVLIDWRGPAWWPWRDRRAPLPRSYFIVKQDLEASRPHLAVMESSIRSIERRCREQLDADFVVFLLPRHIQYNPLECPDCPDNWEAHRFSDYGSLVMEPFRWLDEFRASSDFTCYSLLEAFQETEAFPTCFDNDPHWNREGHRVAAGAIAEALVVGGHIQGQ